MEKYLGFVYGGNTLIYDRADEARDVLINDIY
jgi:hypothetical protein